jgi:DNA polymerase V
MPANPDYEPIAVPDEAELMVWGIVTYVIKQVY